MEGSWAVEIAMVVGRRNELAQKVTFAFARKTREN
jgi:hypothetical protein